MGMGLAHVWETNSPPPDSRNMDAPARSGNLKPKADQAAYNFTESQVATTYAGSMAGTQSDGRTDVSRYSYRSGVDAAKYLKESHGRTVNAVNDAYFLPTDDDEWNRLDKQHTAFLLGFGGLYPAAANVPAVLRPQEGQTKKILDLGCGTGVWTVAMAREYPHAQVLGVDIAPVPTEPENLPDNCRFEVDDINLGLAHFEAQFDLIHARLIGSGIKDFRKTMSDVEKCLRPGGLVLILDAEYALYSTDKFTYRPPASEENPSGSWLQRLTHEMLLAAVLGGSDLPEMEKALDEGLWDHPLIDPESCKTGSLYLPLGPWATGSNHAQAQYVNYVGALMRQDTKSMHRAIHPLLIRSGWPRETLNQWSERADEELSSMKDQVSMRIRLAWGRRREADNESAPPLVITDEESDSSMRPKFPYLSIYASQEESLAQAATRNRNKPLVAPSPAYARKPADS